MTVKELIEILLKYDKDTLIVVDGYEGGVTKNFTVEKSRIVPNVHKEWYYGESEVDLTNGFIEVVYISRERIVEDRDFE